MTTGAELAGVCQQPAKEAIVSRTTTAQLRGRITCLGRGLRGMLLVPTTNAGGSSENSGDKASLHRGGTRQKQESAAPWRLGALPDRDSGSSTHVPPAPGLPPLEPPIRPPYGRI